MKNFHNWHRPGLKFHGTWPKSTDRNWCPNRSSKHFNAYVEKESALFKVTVTVVVVLFCRFPQLTHFVACPRQGGCQGELQRCPCAALTPPARVPLPECWGCPGAAPQSVSEEGSSWLKFVFADVKALCSAVCVLL